MKSSWYNTTGVSILAASFILVLNAMVQEQNHQYQLFAQDQSSFSSVSSAGCGDGCCTSQYGGQYPGSCECCNPATDFNCELLQCGDDTCESKLDCCTPEYGGYDGCHCCKVGETDCESVCVNPPPPPDGPGDNGENGSPGGSNGSSSSEKEFPCTIVRGPGDRQANVVNVVFNFVGMSQDPGLINAAADELFKYLPFAANPDAFQFWYHNDTTALKPGGGITVGCQEVCEHGEKCGLPNEANVAVCNVLCRASATLGSYNAKGMGKSRISTQDRTSVAFVHEFGHQFGGLRDEYGEAGKPSNAGRPNCAPSQAEAQAWWENLFGLTTGIPGCSYNTDNLKPVDNTIMKRAGGGTFGFVNEYYLAEKLCLFENGCNTYPTRSSVSSSGQSSSSAASSVGSNAVRSSIASLSSAASSISSGSSLSSLSSTGASLSAGSESFNSSVSSISNRYPVLCLQLLRDSDDVFKIDQQNASMQPNPVGQQYSTGATVTVVVHGEEYSAYYPTSETVVYEFFGSDDAIDGDSEVVPLSDVEVCIDLDPDKYVVTDSGVILRLFTYSSSIHYSPPDPLPNQGAVPYACPLYVQ